MNGDIEPLHFPEEFKPLLKEEDLDGLEKRDKKLILAISVLEQKLDCTIDASVKNNKDQIKLQTQISQLTLNVQKLAEKVDGITSDQRTYNWQWQLLKWIGTVVGAGIVLKLINTLPIIWK